MIHKLKDSDVTPELLVFLCTLHDLGHLGETAKRLAISEPKASRMLAQLREIFNDPLFTRFGRGLAPTQRTHDIAERAQDALEAMRKLFEMECFSPKGLTRVFRVACLDNAIPMMVEPVIGAFAEAAPLAGFALSPYDERVFTRMRAGEVDLGLFPARKLPSDFLHLPLLKTPYVNVVRADHPLEALLEKQGRISEAQLDQYRRIQIVVHPDVDDPSEGIPGPAMIPLKASKTAIWTNYWLGAVHMLRRTDYVLTMPWRTAEQVGTFMNITVVGRANSVPWLEPSVVWHERMNADPAVQWLRSLFVSEVRGAGPLKADRIKLGRLG